MSDETNLVIGTLAAAIITARGAKAVSEIREAWEDAKRNIYPGKASHQPFKDWQAKNGITPTTPEEDRAAAERHAKALKRLAGSLA